MEGFWNAANGIKASGMVSKGSEMTQGPMLGSKLIPGTILRDYIQEPLGSIQQVQRLLKKETLF